MVPAGAKIVVMVINFPVQPHEDLKVDKRHCTSVYPRLDSIISIRKILRL